MYRLLRRAACVLAALTYFAASAEAVDLQPGLWELTSKVERNGAGSTRQPRSRCITSKAADAARAKSNFDMSAIAKARLSARFGKDACKLVEAKNSQHLVTWRLRCAGSPGAEQEGTARFDDPRHFVVVIRTSITTRDKTYTSVVTTEGQYKGECPR